MQAYRFVLVGFCFLCVAGCAKTDAEARPESTAQATGAHAPATAVPGSHEDWCGEHAVAESQCTLCNPSLAAAFKATGDWCKTHGLPASHCLKCNPNLKITRPPRSQ